MTQERVATYPNFISRMILSSVFRDQWFIPEAPQLVDRFFRWYEKNRMGIDISDIRVDRPVFFISMPRCGSSMLQDLLCAHPNTAFITNMMHQFHYSCCAAEHFRKKMGFDVSGERFLADSIEVSGGSAADAVGSWAIWLQHDPHSLKYTGVRARDYTPEDLEKIHHDIRRMIWCFGGHATRFVCKTPALLPHMLFLNDVFPDARFIHLVRDARMNANSLLKLNRKCVEQELAIKKRKHRRTDGPSFVPYPRLPKLAEYVNKYGADDIRTAAHLWDDGIRFVNDNKHELNSFYEVRYEDILANPKEELFKLIEFCELPEVTDKDELFWARLNKVGVIHHKNTYGNFEVVEDICAETMKQYGYL